MPDRATFDVHLRRSRRRGGRVLAQLGLDAYALYVMDYGAPVGFRLACASRAGSRAVVQNGNAYKEGLSEFWGPIRPTGPTSAQTGPRSAPSWTPGPPVAVQTACRTEAPRARRRGSWTSGSTGRATARSRWTSSSITEQRGALSAVPGVLPGAPAADLDRVGQERSDLPGRGARAPSGGTCRTRRRTCSIRDTSRSRPTGRRSRADRGLLLAAPGAAAAGGRGLKRGTGVARRPVALTRRPAEGSLAPHWEQDGSRPSPTASSPSSSPSWCWR